MGKFFRKRRASESSAFGTHLGQFSADSVRSMVRSNNISISMLLLPGVPKAYFDKGDIFHSNFYKKSNLRFSGNEVISDSAGGK